MLKNPRYERFAIFVAQGSTLDEAYKEAGYKSHRGNPCTVAHRPEVKARIEELTAEFSRKAAKAALISVESLAQEAEEARLGAMSSGQYSAAVQAVKEKGVLSGKRIERQEVGGPGEYEALNDDALERELAERIAQLGLDGGGSETQH